jgi:hypothetical protein
MNMEIKAARMVILPSKMNSHLLFGEHQLDYVMFGLRSSADVNSLPRGKTSKTVHSLLDSCTDQSRKGAREQRSGVKLGQGYFGQP